MQKQPLPEKIILLSENSGALNPVDYNILAESFNSLLAYLAEREEEVMYPKKEVDIEKNTEKKANYKHLNGNCGGVHCKCMNLNKQCPNFHYDDHFCTFVGTTSGKFVSSADHTESWEKDVELIFAEKYVDNSWREAEIKSLIRLLLSQATKAEQDRIVGIVERIKANAQEHAGKDCDALFQGCTECANSAILFDLLNNIRK